MKTLRMSGCSEEHIAELQDRVWEWSYRNLMWMVRHNANLSKRTHWLNLRKKHCLSASQADELALVTNNDVVQDCMTVSALSLKPQLDELLANYGAKLVDPPTLDEGINSSKLSAKTVRNVLPFFPSSPGEPLAPPRVVWTYRIDEWPITKLVEPFLPIDPMTRHMTCWMSTKQSRLPNVFKAIPEEEIKADYDPIMTHNFGIGLDLLDPPFSIFTVFGATLNNVVHASAKMKDVDAFLTANGVKVLKVKEALRMQQSYSQFQDRIKGVYEKNVYDGIFNSWFDEAFLAPEERNGLFNQIHFPKIGVTSVEDRLGILLDKIAEGGADDVDFLAEAIVAQDDRWSLESPAWWILARALRDRVDLQKRAAARGFNRGQRRIFQRRFELAASRRGVKVPPFEGPISELDMPEGIDESVAELLRSRFPLVTDSYVIRLSRVFELDGALMATWEALFSNPEALTKDGVFFGSFHASSGPVTKTGLLLSAAERTRADLIEGALEKLGKMSTEEILNRDEGLFLLGRSVPDDSERSRKGSKVAVKVALVPAGQFVDRGFKIYATLLKWPDPQFAAALKKAKKPLRVDRDAERFHPKIEAFLEKYPLDEVWRASMEKLSWPETGLLQSILPGWGGSEVPYTLASCEDLLLFPNLKEFIWPEEHRQIDPSSFPDHPRLNRVQLPTGYFEVDGAGTNDDLFDVLKQRGFAETSRDAAGFTILEK